MNKVRKWIGERLHILADKVLPIPAYAKGGAYITGGGKVVCAQSSRIVEGREIYERMMQGSLSVEQAKEIVIAEARNEILADIARHTLPMIKYSIVEHGTSQRVYYEVMGQLRVVCKQEL